MPGLMADVDWVVVPSTWWENAPLTIGEAHFHGRPVIASGIGGMAELVRDGENGLTVRPGDAADLANVMRRAIEQPALWRRLASERRAAARGRRDRAPRISPCSRGLTPCRRRPGSLRLRRRRWRRTTMPPYSLTSKRPRRFWNSPAASTPSRRTARFRLGVVRGAAPGPPRHRGSCRRCAGRQRHRRPPEGRSSPERRRRRRARLRHRPAGKRRRQWRSSARRRDLPGERRDPRTAGFHRRGTGGGGRHSPRPSGRSSTGWRRPSPSSGGSRPARPIRCANLPPPRGSSPARRPAMR